MAHHLNYQVKKIFIVILLVILTHLISFSQAVQGVLHGTWSDSTLVASSAHNNTYNEIWGIVAAGTEYAILGTTAGTHFIDVSDPANPTEIIMIPGQVQGPEIIHRDYHDHEGFLYAVADEGSRSTLQIMDLSFLPDSVPVIYDSKQLIRRSHNIFIDSSSSIMYSCISAGDDFTFSPLRLFDISDPYNPTYISDFRTFDGTTIGQVHDAYVIQDTAYLNCGPNGLIIAEFSDPMAPTTLAALGPLDYPQSGYNHSGWLSEDRRTYFMADEDWDMDIKAVDVTALPDLTILDTIDAGNENRFSIPHNQVVHGRYLYTSYYFDGLQVWDIADRENIRRVMHYPTSSIPPRNRYEGAWGVYPFLPSGNILVSDMQEGLFVVQAVEETISNTQEQVMLDASWSISPNPATTHFTIESDHIKDQMQFTLLDLEGRIVKQLSDAENHITDIEAGTYLVRLSDGKQHSTKKLIIVD